MLNKSIISFYFVLVTLLATICEGTAPGWPSNWNAWQCDDWSVELSIYGGYVNKGSKELVFNNTDSDFPYKISQLDWKINNLWVMGGTAQVNFLDDRLHFIFDGWDKVSADKSKMIDQDYFDIAAPSVATSISWHPDTHLNTAYEIDAGLGYDFYCFWQNANEFKFGYLLGYRYLELDWSSYGGSYSYDDGAFVGDFTPGELVITYNQKFSIPYLGLQATWQWNDLLDVRIFGKYSPFAYVKGDDFHALRSVTFIDRFTGADYWVTGIEARWAIWEWVDLDLKYSYERLSNSTGSTTVISDGESVTYNNTAGVGHNHQLISFGLTANF